MKLQSILESSVLATMIAIGVPTGMAHAAGPGDCPFPHGETVSEVARLPGPVAGPSSNITTTPPAPGQILQEACDPGNN